MSVKGLASADEMRSAATRAATAYTHLVLRHREDPVVAVACQLAADTHRVMTALWLKAAHAADPAEQFFHLASGIAARALAVPGPEGARPDLIVGTARREWTRALMALNVPVVFSASNVSGQAAPNFAAARARHLGFRSPGEHVSARQAQVAAKADTAAGVLAGVDAYLVSAAEAAGDVALLTVHARWAWLCEHVDEATPVQAAREHARDVLGPVETVRASAFVRL